MTHAPDRTVYVLGSGRSLLNLTDCEKAYLARQTTVAMNKYLLFWPKIGLFPTHYFLADVAIQAMRVFQETHAMVRRARRPVHFLLDDHYRTLYNQGPRRIWQNRTLLARYRLKRFFAYQPWLRVRQATYFTRPHSFDAPLAWATSLAEPLFFYRGSLSVLLNLLAILPLGRRIKLLGVDLNSAQSFYDAELAQRPDLQDVWVRMQQQAGTQTMHATAMTLPVNQKYQGQPGIQAQWPLIARQMAAAGRELLCCNPHSLLVEQGLCPYAPVIDANDAHAVAPAAMGARPLEVLP